MDKQFIVVAYDISNDRRRTRLHKKLKDFGNPVQYSVFECLLDKEELDKMKAVVKKIIRPRLDHIRYYQLCASCQSKVEVVGRSEVSREVKVIIV